MNILKFILAVILFPLVWLLSKFWGDDIPFVQTYKDFWNYYIRGVNDYE
jgi:hypothetical protein